MNAREQESALLDRCLLVARHRQSVAANGTEANVFRLAGSVLRSRLPVEASRLKQASADYFAQHPDERLSAEDAIRRGLVVSLPRLRDMLSHQLRWNARA